MIVMVIGPSGVGQCICSIYDQSGVFFNDCKLCQYIVYLTNGSTFTAVSKQSGSMHIAHTCCAVDYCGCGCKLSS